MAKEIQEKKEKREAVAQFWPLAGTVHTCVIIDQDGNDVLASSSGFGTKEGEISHQALTLLGNLMSTGHGPLLQQSAMYDTGIRLFGLRIRDRLRVMALDALNFIHQTPQNQSDMIPIGLWNHRPFETAPWSDPYEAVVPSERREDIPWDGLCDFLNIAVPNGVDLDAEARLQAEIARQITLKCGLVCQ